ncbi:MAG TPA: MmgE/PrpD family protein [Micropepsaceae bacterium]|nr:MmgE/PrpD family protein [Micropepsaceae bacterium]
MTIVQRFAEFAAGFETQPVPPEIVHHAKRAVIDWYAALLPGAVVPPATLLERALSEELDHGAAHLALGRKATPRAAALVNGTAAHTMEVDDIFREAIYHPGAPVIAAALAAAEATGSSGEHFLKAVIAGYEISTRIGAAMGRAHYRFWHSTGTVGTFGAAAAAAMIFRLDRQAFAHALATASTFAAGLQQAFRMDSMSKPLHAGRAAEGGLLAAMAARQGVTGSLDIMEGDSGFGRAMGAAPDWDAALATLGREFHIAQITFKNHACCGHTFAAIDGALEVQKTLGVPAAAIARVRVKTYGEALAVAGNAQPATPAEARFSLPYVVATALVHGSVRLAAFDQARIADAATRGLMDRIALVVDPGIDAAFPGRRAALVTIETKDGRIERYLQQTRKGDPDMPLTDKELEEKYLELTVPVIGRSKAASLLERLWRLDSQQSLDLH